MKNIFYWGFLAGSLTALLAGIMTGCTKCQADTSESNRIVKIESVIIKEVCRVAIIKVDGKEYIVNSQGGIIEHVKKQH